MKAKKKPMRTVQVADLLAGEGAGSDSNGATSVEEVLRSRLEPLSVVEPPPRKGGVKVESVDALVEKLRELKAL